MSDNYDVEFDDDEIDDDRDITGMSFDDYIRICEELNPGSTGYTSDID